MAGYSALARRIAAQQRALADAGLLRTLRPPQGIDLCSNDYLALARHPRLEEQMIDAVRREGCGSTGSRLLRGERDAFTGLERQFAAFKRTGRSLYFSSGYLANLAVLTAFPEAGDVILSDERNHASLIDGIRLSAARRVVFPHGDVEALGRLLEQQPGGGQAFVVVESLYSMDGDIAPLRRLRGAVPGHRRGADRRRGARRRRLRRAWQRPDRGVRHRHRRLRLREHGRQGARRERRVRRRAGMGDRAPRPTRAPVHLFDRAASSRRRRARREPFDRRRRAGTARDVESAVGPPPDAG